MLLLQGDGAQPVRADSVPGGSELVFAVWLRLTPLSGPRGWRKRRTSLNTSPPGGALLYLVGPSGVCANLRKKKSRAKYANV